MLNKLYSKTRLLLKDVIFHPGINIILGKYSGNLEPRNINGIGKSSLVRLINYLLLSKRAEKLFKKPTYDFLRKEEHKIALEFQVNEKKYIIERTFNSKDKIGFGENPDFLQQYTCPELKQILESKFFPINDRNIFYEGKHFRSLMNFFVKDDLDNLQRIDPLNFISPGKSLKKGNAALFNCFLLNLPTGDIIKFNELTEEYRGYLNTIKQLEEKIITDTGKSPEEWRSEKLKIEDNIKLLEKGLTDFRFLEGYKNIEGQIIDLTKLINEKLKQYHSFNRKLKNVKESYQVRPALNTREIKNLYNEALDTFGDLVCKTIDEITAFQKNLLENRNRYLAVKERDLENRIAEILKEISVLESQRSVLYKKLEEKGALESITNAYEQLINEKTNLERNLQTLNQIDEFLERAANSEIAITQVKHDIRTELKKYENQQNNLRGLFREILENAIFLNIEFQNAYFDISTRKRSAKNQLPFSIEVEIPKADALGQSRIKIVAYDLMIFLDNIRKERLLPDFLIHDGVFHGVSRSTVINTLNYIFHQFLEKKNFQYIASFNEDEILIPDEKRELYGSLKFNLEDHIVAEYEDTPSKMIFKKEFN